MNSRLALDPIRVSGQASAVLEEKNEGCGGN